MENNGTNKTYHCGTCLHAYPTKHGMVGKLICRRNPPTPLQDSKRGVWPYVNEDECCGEWRRKYQEEE